MAPIGLTQQNRPLNGPWIAELTLPTSLPAGTYKLRCGSAECPVRLRVGRLSIIGPDTSVVSWGTGGVVLEDGLTQRLRLPLFLGASRSQQTESLYTDLSGLSRRNRATARSMLTLTTTTQSAQFHRAMWAMLKSDSVSIDDKPYTQQGDYATSEGSPPNYRGQGRCTVLGLTQADTRPLWSNASGSESNSYAVVTSLNGPDNLTIWLRGYTFEGVVSAGLNLPVGEYELHVSVGHDALRLTIESGGMLISYTLLPDRTNRLRNVRLNGGPSAWTLDALNVKLLTGANVANYGDPETVLSQTAQATALRDFSTDYNADFK